MKKRCFKFLSSSNSLNLWSIICRINLKKNIFFDCIINNSNKIMCADGGSNYLYKYIKNFEKKKIDEGNINPDYSHLLPEFILGDFDSIEYKSKKYFNDLNIEMKKRDDQNYSDLEKLLYEIEKFSELKNSEETNLAIFANGERLDHFFYNLNICLKKLNSGFYKKKNFFIIGDKSYITLIKKGKTIINPSEFDLHSFIGILPLEPSRNINTKGLKWNLCDKNDFKWGFFHNLSSSNCIKDKAREVVIESDVDVIWTSSINEEKWDKYLKLMGEECY